MDKEIGKRVIYLRFDGYSVQSIAKDIEKSPQVVTIYIKKITKSVEKVHYAQPPYLPVMSKQDKIALSNLIVDTNGDVEAIQKQLQPSFSAEKILVCLRQKKPIQKQSCLSPALDAWRRQTGTTIIELADKAEIPRSTMEKILHCRTHLRLDRAQRIKAITGVSLRDLYANQIKAINMEIHQAKVPETQLIPPTPIVRSWTEEGPRLAPVIGTSGNNFVCPPKKKEEQSA